VKPPPFEYHAPGSVEEALSLLAGVDGARVLAGGQSLLQLMKFRRAKPRALVDINDVGGLDGIEQRDGELYVGALVRQQRLLEDGLVERSWPLLREAARFVGYAETRRRGTVGGSLAFAAPWAELSAAAVALDAAIDARSIRGLRSIPARSFFRGPGETALEGDELITGVRFPVRPRRSGASFHEVSARYRDYAQAAAAALVDLDDAGECTSAEVVLLGVARTPRRVDVTQMVMEDPSLEGLRDVLEPDDDVEASAEYRRRVAPILARRALSEALGSARTA
jgi:carbon-monoxide dehydrogenase medium subunit